MRTPRDILVVGIGFLLGMIFCYFLMAPKPVPNVTNAVMSQAQTLHALRTSMAAEVTVPQPGNVRRVILDSNTLKATREPNYWLQPDGSSRPRIVPALSEDGAYDLIDLNYVPDFEIDLD